MNSKKEAHVKIHYGTVNGPACGQHFRHDGVTNLYDKEAVTPAPQRNPGVSCFEAVDR